MGLPGNIAELAFALQSAKGTPAGAAQFRARITGGGLAPMKDVEDLLESTGARMLEGSFVARVRAEGAPAFIVRPKFIGLLAYAAMGAKAVSGAGDPYTHTFTLATSLPYLTAYRMLADAKYERFIDCKVAKLHFESAANGLLIATATILGLTPQHASSAAYGTEVTVAVETADPFLHADGSGALQVEAAAVAAIERFVLDIDNTGAIQYGDSVTGFDISEARQVISVETTQLITDFALWNRMLYDSATPADATVPTRNVLELGGSPAGIDFKFTRPGAPPEHSIEFLVPRLQVGSLTGLEMNTNGDPLKMAAMYKAYKPASGSGATIKLKNSQASYVGLP